MPGRSEEEETEARDLVRDRAIRIGTAFHRVMESAVLDAQADTESLAGHEGQKLRLDRNAIGTVMEMVSRTLASPLMKRVRRSVQAGGRPCCELPYVRPIGIAREGVEEGKIDLLFREDGRWVLVDYKTDAIPVDQDVSACFREKYAEQMRAYASALKEVGISVASAYLLLARTGEAVEVTMGDADP
jgi:ATP-dependent helicase/nuclease subunit A